ncbi:MAG: hypothetical protein SFU56_06335 [Capsulimonadales bacterium]|nr:hypothetical protein [Capsulimonadales bacterium]
MTPIYQLVDSLPADNVTVRVLRALDFVAPGQWQNPIGFENTISLVTGETDPQTVFRIRNRAIELYNDASQGYQRAIWIYQTVDNTDKALGMAAMANKVGEKVGFLSFLSKITPKADKVQTLDLSLKLIAELIAFTQTNGLPGDSIGDFVQALGAYERESLIRMSALVAFDGVIPLGDNFLNKVADILEGQTRPQDLEQNTLFQRIRGMVPGGDTMGQLGFLTQNFGAVRNWIGGLVAERGITQHSVADSLRRFVDISDDKLDFVAGFLDSSTNYYEHTGIQSVARSIIERAVSEI